MINKEESKTYLYYKKKIIVGTGILLLLLGFCFGSFFISHRLKEVITVDYKEKSSTDYLVFLKENDYYKDKYLGKGMHYIASLIDYIDIQFNYDFEINDEIIYVYSYDLDALVKVFEKGNASNLIFEESNKLIKEKKFDNQKELRFSIRENIKIDYSEYNDLVRKFKTSYNLVADSNLVLTLNVKIEGKHENIEEKIKTNSKTSLIIPLTEQMINIKMEQKDINSQNNSIEFFKNNFNSIFFLIIGVVFFVVSIIVLIFLIFNILKLSSKKTPYKKRLESLLREYDKIIVESSNCSILKEEVNLIKVKTFEELVDVSDRLEKPILHFEVRKDSRSQFIVKDSDSAYFYVIDSKKMVEK